MYSIPDLETFVAVARGGGITAAARQLGISGATVSHRIGKLEQVLKVTLFLRNSRSFALTDEGRIFLERIEGILDDLYQAEAEAGGGNTSLRGHLRVTLSPWILSRFIMPHLGGFRRAHPQLAIEFLAVDRFVSLVEERQDCAIRVGQLTSSSLIARKLSRNDRIICASPGFLSEYGVPRTIGDLQDAPWVCLPWQMRFDLRAPNGTVGQIAIRPNVTVSHSDMLTEGAAQGLGLAVKSRLAVQEELDAGKLVEVMPGTLHPSEAPIWFVTSPDARSGRKTKAFADLCAVAFRHCQV